LYFPAIIPIAGKQKKKEKPEKLTMLLSIKNLTALFLKIKTLKVQS